MFYKVPTRRYPQLKLAERLPTSQVRYVGSKFAWKNFERTRTAGKDGVSWTHEADHSMQRAHLIVSAMESEAIKGMQTRERVTLLPVLRVSEGKEQFQPLADADLHRR